MAFREKPSKQLSDVEQKIVIYQWLAGQLVAQAEG